MLLLRRCSLFQSFLVAIFPRNKLEDRFVTVTDIANTRFAILPARLGQQPLFRPKTLYVL